MFVHSNLKCHLCHYQFKHDSGTILLRSLLKYRNHCRSGFFFPLLFNIQVPFPRQWHIALSHTWFCWEVAGLFHTYRQFTANTVFTVLIIFISFPLPYHSDSIKCNGHFIESISHPALLLCWANLHKQRDEEENCLLPGEGGTSTSVCRFDN